MNFSDYCNKNNISQVQAARELGITRQWASRLCAGDPAGKGLSFKIEKWSRGEITANEAMCLHQFSEQQL
jgi:hypothetical protein